MMKRSTLSKAQYEEAFRVIGDIAGELWWIDRKIKGLLEVFG